ncbi:MAG: hypothetical protein LBL82_05515 [Oscillospiraceae bacterium]|jgi:CheY-like chemotaxis protein|nr:hypothetical protein [Oscillospiraceae bacterium]
MILFNVLTYDDDPVYLDLLKEEILTLHRYAPYEISLFQTTSSRFAMQISRDNYIDVFLLDICARVDTKSRLDTFDYQGSEFYSHLIATHPRNANKKIMIVSNLREDLARKVFDYAPIDYFHKPETSPKMLAQHLKVYFDLQYKHTIDLNKKPIDDNNDDTRSMNINFGSNNNVIVATGYSTVNQTTSDTAQLNRLVETIHAHSSTELTNDERTMLNDYLTCLQEEMSAKKPKKNILRILLSSLNALKGSAEFAAAIAALVQFIQPMLE